jgi:hypothetical protein
MRAWLGRRLDRASKDSGDSEWVRCCHEPAGDDAVSEADDPDQGRAQLVRHGREEVFLRQRRGMKWFSEARDGEAAPSEKAVG